MDKHLVVGITGGIGRATAKALVEKGKKVIGFARNEEKAKKYIDGLDGVELFIGDAANIDDLRNALKEAKYLHYCVNIPYDQWEAKSEKLLAVSVDAAVEANAKLIFPGNVYVYGEPQYTPVNEGHPHAPMTKKGRIRDRMEKSLWSAWKEHGLNYSIIRMPDFYGPFVVNDYYDKIFRNALKGKKITWYGDLKVPIEFIYIEDGGKAMAAAALSSKADHMIFNIPGYKPTTAKEFLKTVVKHSGKRSSIRGVNIEALVLIAGLFNPVAREFRELFYLKQQELILNGNLYKTTFGELPATPYEEGIKKTLEWTKQFFKL